MESLIRSIFGYLGFAFVLVMLAGIWATDAVIDLFSEGSPRAELRQAQRAEAERPEKEIWDQLYDARQAAEWAALPPESKAFSGFFDFQTLVFNQYLSGRWSDRMVDRIEIMPCDTSPNRPMYRAKARRTLFVAQFESWDAKKWNLVKIDILDPSAPVDQIQSDIEQATVFANDQQF